MNDPDHDCFDDDDDVPTIFKFSGGFRVLGYGYMGCVGDVADPGAGPVAWSYSSFAPPRSSGRCGPSVVGPRIRRCD